MEFFVHFFYQVCLSPFPTIKISNLIVVMGHVPLNLWSQGFKCSFTIQVCNLGESEGLKAMILQQMLNWCFGLPRQGDYPGVGCRPVPKAGCAALRFLRSYRWLHNPLLIRLCWIDFLSRYGFCEREGSCFGQAQAQQELLSSRV